MKTLTLRSDTHPASVTIALDDANGRAIVLARGSDEQIQVPYLELNFRGMSASLFNSSDLGLTCDNNGLTTIHQLAVEGQCDLLGAGFKCGKVQITPDGTIKVGEALTIDDNGIMTLNGAEFRIDSGYNLIFAAGGGPVLTAPGGGKFKLIVNDEGHLSTVSIPA